MLNVNPRNSNAVVSAQLKIQKLERDLDLRKMSFKAKKALERQIDLLRNNLR
jgi:hypothetical protein